MKNQEQQAFDYLHQIVYEHKQAFFDKIPEVFKTIIIVASGMISLVLLLHKNIVPQDAQNIQLIRLAIVLLFLAVVLGLAALYGLAQIHLDTISYIVEAIRKKGSAEAVSSLQYETIKPKMIYTFSNYFSIISFFLSLIFLTWFALINI